MAYALSLLTAVSDTDIHGKPLPSFDISVEQGVPAVAPPRIAVARLALWERAEPQQRKLFDDTVAKLKSAGASVEDVTFTDLDKHSWDSCMTIMASEASVIYSDLIARHPDRISDHMKLLVKNGKATSAYDYLVAKHRQTQLRQATEAQISDFDVILTLPAFGEAPEGLNSTGDADYCAPWTLLGLPALSLPAGFGNKGLPLGVQVVGKYRQDRHTLGAAKWIESALAFKPGLAPVAH